MNRALPLLWTLAVVLLAGPAALAAAPTRLTLSTPASVSIGEEIVIEARLATAGRPVAGALLTLSQVGAVGERVMNQARTDEGGVAFFSHNEFTVASLGLRVAFAGDAAHGPSRADAVVAIIEIAVRPSVLMRHTPAPMVKAILFGLLGAVWLTYLYAGTSVLRIARERGPARGGDAARRRQPGWR